MKIPGQVLFFDVKIIGFSDEPIALIGLRDIKDEFSSKLNVVPEETITLRLAGKIKSGLREWKNQYSVN